MKFSHLRPGRPVFILFLVALSLFAAIFVLWNQKSTLPNSEIQNVDPSTASARPLKIITSEEGIYELRQDDLQSARLGNASLTKASLVLSNLGQPQTFWVSDDQEKLWFFAQGIDSRYSSENIYWLGAQQLIRNHLGDGELGRAAEATPGVQLALSQAFLAQLPPNSYAALTHQEENLVYNPLVSDGAPWLWALLPAPTSKEIPVELKNFTPGPGMLRLSVWGSTEAATSPDHHLRVRVNGVQIADQAWDGQGRRVIEAEIPPGLLTKGENHITLDLPGDLEAPADLVYLDWVEFYFPGKFVAVEDRLSFMSPGGRIRMAGFSGPVDIFDISDPDRVIRVAQGIDARAGFDSQAGNRYWIVGPSGYLVPKNVQSAGLTPDLRSLQNSANYLAIGPPELLAAYQPVLELRAEQGIQGMAIPIEAVYDQFSHGMVDPQAIRALLGYAKQNWAGSPKFLVLVGDASYDTRGYQTAPQANQVPTFFVQTVHGGETASDYGFSIPGESSWQLPGEQPSVSPEIAVGRIPARSPDEVKAYVQKVLAYEQQAGEIDPENPWQKRILAVADGSDPGFKNDAEVFLGNIPTGFQTELLAPQSGEQGVNQTVSARINQGDWLVAYFGHGSINLWGKDRLFTTQDIPDLNNFDRLPVILNFTCLNGLFTHPKENSLADAFLWQPGGGAVAVLAPTSLTLPEDQSYLSNSLAKELIGNTDARLGELLTRARNQMLAENPSDRDVLFTFLLFGDPALKLARPAAP